MGGSFVNYWMNYMQNCATIVYQGLYTMSWFTVDSTINKMEMFKGDLISGGKFKTGYKAPLLNGIAGRRFTVLAVPSLTSTATFNCYPNPVPQSRLITISNSFNARAYRVYDINGKRVADGVLCLQPFQQVQIPELSPGTYAIEAWNDKGQKMVKQLVVN